MIINTQEEIYTNSLLALEGTKMEGYPIHNFIPDLDLGIQYIKLEKENEEALYQSGVKWPKIFHQDISLAGKENGIRIVQVFETDKKDIVQSRLNSILGKSKRIYARKCEIVELTDIKDFFIDNHIQKYVFSKLKYGLVYDGELVAAATFSKAKRVAAEYKGLNVWELVRYANLLNHTVVGGASKLFTHFTRNNNFDMVISYADRRYSAYKNTLYDNLGFEHSHDSLANYFYYRPETKILESRMKYQKNKLNALAGFNFDPSKTEYQNCLNNGLQKIWDCGNAVYVYFNV